MSGIFLQLPPQLDGRILIVLFLLCFGLLNGLAAMRSPVSVMMLIRLSAGS